jgi:hypothetical protein
MAIDPEIPSFFVLLELDPDEPWNQARFEEVLKEKQSRWSNDRVKGVGRKKEVAQRFAPLVPTIHAEMSDPATRAAHAERARAERASGARESLEQLEAELEAKGARGFLVRAEVDELLRRYGPALGEAEVRTRVARLPVRDEATPAPAAAPMEPSVKRTIDDKLRQAGLEGESLYAFVLGDRSTSGPAQRRQISSAALLAHATTLYQELGRTARKTAEVTLRQELAGLCMTWLGSDEQRARYDVSIQEEGLTAVLQKARMAAGPTHALTVRQVDALVRDAVDAGVSPDDARARLQAFAREQRWSIEVSSTDGQLLCGCGEYNDAGTACCRRCGEALRIACPGCGEQAGSDAAACSRCGFPLGNRFLARVLLDEARTLADEGDTAAAARRLAEAARTWPAGGADPLAGELAAERRRVGEAEAAAQAAVQELRAMAAARRHYAAHRRAAELQRAGVRHPEIADLGARAGREVESAEAQLREVRQLPAGEEAAGSCQRILSACADCEPARRILEAIPPAPPAGLEARVRGASVALAWRPGTSSQARYTVVRKARTRPSGPGDGVPLALVEGTRFDDGTPEVGVDLYYAVFAEREGVASREAAHLAVPVLVVADVEGLTARVGDGEVRLDWTPPPNAERVFALREAGGGAPAVRLDSADGRQVVDRDVTNGREYRYTVRCEFRPAGGAPVLSPGAAVAATPQVPPAPLEALELTPAETGSGRVLRISWAPPARGEVRIVASDEPLSLAGEVLPVRELARRGEVLAGIHPPLTDEWREGASRCYTPALVLGEAAYPGPSHRYVFLDDVAGVQGAWLGDRVRLTWTWPRGCAEAEVACGAGGWPDAAGSARPPTQVTRVSRAEYDRGAGCDVRPSAGTNADLFVVVRAVASVGGERVVSGGTSAGARRRVPLRSRLTLEYEVLPPGLLRRVPRLRVRASREAELPALRLVRKRGMPPLDRGDGECVLQLGPTRVSGQAEFPLDAVPSGERGFARLFLESEQDYEWTTVLQPDRARLQL